MQILQVTLGSGATQVSSNPTSFQFITIQNNSANTIRVGDATVSSSQGISIAAGSYHDFSFPQQYASDLSEWYIAGTSGNVVDILFLR